MCVACNSLLTVEHTACVDFDINHQHFYTASNLKDLFHSIHPKQIIPLYTSPSLQIKFNFLRHDIAAICMLKNAVKS